MPFELSDCLAGEWEIFRKKELRSCSIYLIMQNKLAGYVDRMGQTEP